MDTTQINDEYLLSKLRENELEKICRCCFTIEDNMQSIFAKCFERNDTLKFIYEILSINFLGTDKFPSLICKKCLQKLEIINSFRQQCIQTQKILHLYVNNSIPNNCNKSYLDVANQDTTSHPNNTIYDNDHPRQYNDHSIEDNLAQHIQTSITQNNPVAIEPYTSTNNYQQCSICKESFSNFELLTKHRKANNKR
ncbi:uncharacterized protein LOC113385899 [Ctenocephalides felis]|uniref:uncharacterized protein LOC113385899 n=1 Tax=Ctenocephalides felis TaxID=7515 RepID=UPI000E6E2B7F|nr:uncharacterized protein LOC113385899 [Ctenocephalides felis]